MSQDAINETAAIPRTGPGAGDRQRPLRTNSDAPRAAQDLPRAEAGGPGGGALSEGEARDLLRACGPTSPLDAWLAGQPWVEVPGGWHVGPARQGWRFEIRVIPEGLQVCGHAHGQAQRATRVVPKALVAAS
jgi:hypothetical protein